MTDAIHTRSRSEATRFSSYRLGNVLVTIEPSPLEDPCHVWQGTTVGGGYPMRRVDGKLQEEHRRVWEAEHGPIPPRWDVHHLCGRRRCINLQHLEAMPRGEHLRRHRSEPLPDGVATVVAVQAGLSEGGVTDHRRVLRTHCQRGHAMTPDNVIPHHSGRGRLCKTCDELRKERRRA